MVIKTYLNDAHWLQPFYLLFVQQMHWQSGTRLLRQIHLAFAYADGDVYWRPGRENLGDYHTKHHSAQHHKDMRHLILHEANSLQVL
jgi:hypothetical protein